MVLKNGCFVRATLSSEHHLHHPYRVHAHPANPFQQINNPFFIMNKSVRVEVLCCGWLFGFLSLQRLTVVLTLNTVDGESFVAEFCEPVILVPLTTNYNLIQLIPSPDSYRDRRDLLQYYIFNPLLLHKI